MDTNGDSTSPEYQLTSTGSYALRIDDVEMPEWHDDMGDTLDPAELYAIRFQIRGAEKETEYDFCISDLEPY